MGGSTVFVLHNTIARQNIRLSTKGLKETTLWLTCSCVPARALRPRDPVIALKKLVEQV